MFISNQPQFTFEFDDGALLLEDIGDEGCMSLTNGMELALKKLIVDWGYGDRIKRDTVIVYRDSTGNWDGVNYNGPERLVGFYYLGAKSAEEAVRLAISKKSGGGS